MEVNLTMSDKHIMLLFGKIEGRLLYEQDRTVLYSERSLLGELYRQLPCELQHRIDQKYIQTVNLLKSAGNIT